MFFCYCCLKCFQLFYFFYSKFLVAFFLLSELELTADRRLCFDLKVE